MRALIQKFVQLESSGGIVLFIATAFAILWANSKFYYIYQEITDNLLFFINEGLMSIFFLLVGLELKRGFLEGDLSKFSQIILPAVAALGGMLVPALIYLSFNYTNPLTIKAWATPVATDIAFALGALSLFGRRVPTALKLFLLALAIFDDIGSILIIALFYSNHLIYLYIFLSFLIVMVLYLFRLFSIRLLSCYLLVGMVLWMYLLYSGIHPTIAGVLLAMTIPGYNDDPAKGSLLHRLEDSLHPWVVYLIMPLFALANAGFSFHELSFNILIDTVVLGIMLGLFVGKQIGVFGFSWLLIKLGIARLPTQTSLFALYGVSILCGIGFTMSLFLGTLAFQGENTYLAEIRLGVIIGSILSGLFGLGVLSLAFSKSKSVE
ncbi:MAG TPA: Na+/H+ antiporter NhaA [Gammaproteobacteria bacterium]|nr:Na+/H+ antiporter NhaA [Gammaproteobacteria bacterium]